MATDHQDALRRSLHKARAALKPYHDVVEPILHGEPVHKLAYLASMATKSRATAEIMRRARAGLQRLAKYYGITRLDAPPSAFEVMERERTRRALEYMARDQEDGLQIIAAGRARAGTEISDPDGADVGAASGLAHVDVFAKKLEGGDPRGLTSIKHGYDPARDDAVEVDEDVGEIELAAAEGGMSKRALGDMAEIADATDEVEAVETPAEDAKTLKLLKAESSQKSAVL